MSYDFCAAVDAGGSEPHYIEPSFSDTHPAFSSDGMAGTAVMTATGYARCGNYTSNVSRTWSKCLTAALADPAILIIASAWRGDDDRRMRRDYASQADRPIETARLRLRDLDGKRMGDIAPVLRAAVAWGVERIADLREDNPPNGWGNAEGAVTYLWDIARFCEMHPDARLDISS